MVAQEAPSAHRSNMNALRLFASISLLPLALLGCSDDDGDPASHVTCDGGPDATVGGRDTGDWLGYDAGDRLPDASWDVVLPGPYEPMVCAPVAPARSCDRSLCGNGTIEAAVCATGTVPEVCDGDVLGDATCESLGYAGGTLGCRNDCHYDTSQCSLCDPTLSNCTQLSSDEGVAAQASIIDGTRLVVASAGATGLRLRILQASDFSLISETECFGRTRLGQRHVALAKLPGGYIVAETSGSSTQVYTFDDSGTLLGERTEEDMYGPIFASRPDGGPLLIWQAFPENVARVSLLDEGGEALYVRELFANPLETDYGEAAYVGDGFLVALRGPEGVRIDRVEMDGTLTSTHLPGGDGTQYPRIDWNGSVAHVTWHSFYGDPQLYWATYSSAGSLTNGPVALEGCGRSNQAEVLASENGATLLLDEHTGRTGVSDRLWLQSIDNEGNLREVRPLVTAGRQGDAILLGTTGAPIAAWVQLGHPGSLGLAALDPLE